MESVSCLLGCSKSRHTYIVAKHLEGLGVSRTFLPRGNSAHCGPVAAVANEWARLHGLSTLDAPAARVILFYDITHGAGVLCGWNKSR